MGWTSRCSLLVRFPDTPFSLSEHCYLLVTNPGRGKVVVSDTNAKRSSIHSLCDGHLSARRVLTMPRSNRFGRMQMSPSDTPVGIFYVMGSEWRVVMA